MTLSRCWMCTCGAVTTHDCSAPSDIPTRFLAPSAGPWLTAGATHGEDVQAIADRVPKLHAAVALLLCTLRRRPPRTTAQRRSTSLGGRLHRRRTRCQGQVPRTRLDEAYRRSASTSQGATQIVAAAPELSHQQKDWLRGQVLARLCQRSAELVAELNESGRSAPRARSSLSTAP